MHYLIMYIYVCRIPFWLPNYLSYTSMHVSEASEHYAYRTATTYSSARVDFYCQNGVFFIKEECSDFIYNVVAQLAF